MNWKKVLTGLTGLTLAVIINISCASKVVEVPPLPVPVLSAEPGFAMKPYHYSMQEEMQTSYELADEIILAEYAAKLDDGVEETIYYFDNFKRFNKQAMSWGPVNDVLIPVYSRKFKPEIILDHEFKNLSELDKVGICWDPLEDGRFVYLVGGQQHLVFLRQEFKQQEGMTRIMSRYLIDSYPVTDDCSADQVFEQMLRDYAVKK